MLARHGESTLNVARIVNGDPTVEVRLTEKGRHESELLGRQLNIAADESLVWLALGRLQRARR